jgi:hypothetical protein
MTLELDPSDLAPFASIPEAKAQAMVDVALAQARRVAPCLKTTDDEDALTEARGVLIAAVLRWHETGVASYAVQSAGPPGYPADPTSRAGNMLLWPSEIKALEGICSSLAVLGEPRSGAFSIDTTPAYTRLLYGA